MAKNHYVSQFIIKRFSDAINVFDIHSGKINESKRPHKVFYKDDIYDVELEKLMNCNIESRVANLLSHKLLVGGDITLTRADLFLLKRYMLLCSVRTMDVAQFKKALLNFEHNADRYLDLRTKTFNDKVMLPKTRELSISDSELYLRGLKVFAKTKDIRDIMDNPLATREMIAWAIPFIDGYLAFWDAPNDKEYVLTDCGMCSEYEGFHLMTGGVDISKNSFLWAKVKEGKVEYSSVMLSQMVMFENYSIFNITSKRSMILINPFFRLYYGQKVMLTGDNWLRDYCILEKPDIWPAILQNRELFAVPKNRYKIAERFFSEEDEFIYQPKVLTNEDLIYINTLMLSQTKEIIGFNNATKIIDSIYYYVWYNANFNSVKSKSDTDIDVMNNLVKNVVDSPFRDLCSYCDAKGGINKTEFIFLFEKLLGNIFKDFNENIYIADYYLSMPDETARFKVLDFLGEGNKKIEFFKKHKQMIMEKKNNV